MLILRFERCCRNFGCASREGADPLWPGVWLGGVTEKLNGVTDGDVYDQLHPPFSEWFLFSPLTTPSVVAAKTRVQRCLCREVDEIWQYRTGGNLMTFNQDHGTAEEGLQKQGSCSQAYGFATITMYSWWKSNEIGCA